MLDPGFQECVSMDEWTPDSCLGDQGNDVLGGGQDHVISGGVCNGFIPDLMDPGL